MAFSIVQHPTPTSGTSNSISGSATAPAWSPATTAGNLLVNAITFRGNATVTASGGFTQAATIQNGTTCQTEIWYKVALGSDATPVFTISTSTLFVIDAAEVTGFLGTPAVDQTGTASGSGVNSVDPVNNFAIGPVNEFTFACAGNAEGNTASVVFNAPTSINGLATGPTSLDTTNPGKNGEGLQDAWGVGFASSANDIQFNLSSATNTKLAACIVSFKDVIIPGYVLPVRIANRYVGPQVLRFYYRQPTIWGPTTIATVNNLLTLAAATLTFTGPTNLTKAVTKGVSGGLSFTGPTNLVNAITKGLVAVLSFTGAITKATTKGLPAAILSFTGAFSRQLQKKLSGVLSFTGPVNLVKVITKLISGTLTFTGPVNLTKAITKGLTAGVLSFTGAITKAISKGLITAALSFTGAITIVRQFNRSLSATLTFTGPTNLTKAINKSINGTLSFTGAALVKAITKGVSGTLTFTGAITKAITKGLTAAALTFTGVLTTVRQFNRSLTAVLSFTGPTNLVKNINKGVNGTLSFAGAALVKNVTKGISGGLSFTGATLKNAITKGLPGATLTFTGTVTKQLKKLLTGGVLSFTGAISNRTNKGLTAVLSFTGSPLVKATTKGVSANLTFTGAALVKAITKSISGSLSFTGNIIKQVRKGLTAALSLVGSLVSGSGAHQFTQALTASLSFTGSQVKQTSKTLSAAVLTFVGNWSKIRTYGRTFVASLSSQGNLLNLRWYYGVFKYTSVGLLRAVRRVVTQFITQNRRFT